MNPVHELPARFARTAAAEHPASPVPPEEVTIAWMGDAMLGRGVDQILPHPSDPVLYERLAGSAKDYLRLAQRASGSFATPVGLGYIWGDAIADLATPVAALRIVNLETSITTSATPAAKDVLYRMHPANAACLRELPVDCCVLANNHVLDWGRAGLRETLRSLDALGIAHAGAGRSACEAAAPAILPIAPTARVLVYGYGLASSGIPEPWRARHARAGIQRLEPSTAALERIARRVRAQRLPGDLVVASVHWGGNWGYPIEPEQRELAHALIDVAGFDLVHGHSSHHAKGIEIHRGRLILHGCGDFINDYEGLGGRTDCRADLAVAYLARCRLADGTLSALTLFPYRIRRMRLQRADGAEREALRSILDRESAPLGTHVGIGADGQLTAYPSG